MLQSQSNQSCPEPAVCRILDAYDDVVDMAPHQNLNCKPIQGIGTVNSPLLVLRQVWQTKRVMG
jgi:hypothetical protein